MSMNTKLTIATVIVCVIAIAIAYIRAKYEKSDIPQTTRLTFERLLNIVEYRVAEIAREEYPIGYDDEELQAASKRRARLTQALDDCMHGVDNAKIQVIDLIKSVLIDEVPDEESLCKVVNFNSEYLNPHYKFEVLMYFEKKIHGKGALAAMIDEYDLSRPRNGMYYITIDDIEEIYKDKNYILNYGDMLEVLAVLIYQKYKGFDCVDTIREMDIDGLLGGVSGSTLNKKSEFPAEKSIWIYYRGIYMHLRFLTFHNEATLRRVTQQLVKYNSPGPLTEEVGMVVTTSFDQSRIVGQCKPAFESWAFMIRKFVLHKQTLNSLLIKEYTNNGEVITKLLHYLALGLITCAVTGMQGSGKTTLLRALLGHIDPSLPIGVLEMAPELYLRELYPDRDIISAQETATVSAEDIQDILKKSDRAISVVGEVATDPVASQMIQMGLIASLSTYFSHHANKATDLIRGLRNSLVNAGGFTSMATAEHQVIDVVKIDIHAAKTTEGKRYIERITEIIPSDEGTPYPEIDPRNYTESQIKIQKEFFQRTTDRMTFTTRDILVYDLETDTYKTSNWLTPELTERLMNNLPATERKEFEQFVFDNWEVI